MVGRDHALGIHRFLGWAQLLGGVTLTAAYSFGAPALGVDGAAGALVVIGLVQIVAGLLFIFRTRALRNLIVRRPGLFVAFTLAGAALVWGLGGSNREALFVTSGMAWQVAAGYALPGWRWAVVSAWFTAVIGAVWVLVEGHDGGYLKDGNFGPALIELAAASAAGLWLGRIAGSTFATLNRWHLVELHERGLVERIRARLRTVDEQAAALSGLLPRGDASSEIAALRERLRRGVGLGAEDAPTTLADLADELAAEYADARQSARLEIGLEAAAGAAGLPATVADVLASVIRRQLLNVGRHAPDATVVRIAGELRSTGLVLRVEDNGGGRLAFRAGTGTQWSARQLGRVGGTARYYAGEAGVGFEVAVPVAPTTTLSQVPGLSVRGSLAGFGLSMLTALRIAGYVGDSLTAYVAQGEIGERWLCMPIGAILIELAIRFGIPGFALGRDTRLILATAISVAITGVFAIPGNSPEILIPATTSVVIPAQLLFVRRSGWWLCAELFRLAAAVPLLVRYGAASVELVLIYPALFSLLVVMVARYIDRATGLERTAADGLGRAALAGATVRGLALHHDAIDVILRVDADASAGAGAELRSALTALELALTELDAVANDTLDPREVMLTGIQAALIRPVEVDGEEVVLPGARRGRALAGAIDRITLVELAALAADERASCAPPGALGRRRLRTMSLAWSPAAGGRGAELTVIADPQLRAPDRQAVERLEAVAHTLGVGVDSTDARLRLTYAAH